MKKIIIILIVLISNISFLNAEENTEKKPSINIPAKKEKVVIYYFQDKSESDKFGYLSSIIPDSIAKDINRIGEYETETFPVNVDYLDSSASDEDQNNFIQLLMNMDKEVKADFMLIGSYYVEGNQIVILTQFFDVERQKIIYVGETESKISAIVLEMIEDATNNIISALKKAAKIKREEKEKADKVEEDRKLKISPYLGFYNSLSGLTFSVNYGRADFFRDGGDMYKNTDHVSLNLFYGLNNIAFSGKFEYFATRTKESYNKNNNRNRNFELTGGSLNFSYLFKFSPNFNIAASAGGGMADVKIIMEADSENSLPAVTLEDSFHPYFNLLLSMNYYIGNLKIESGYSYNIINVSKKIDYSVIYFGLGYRI
jgi:TolB-like protein